MPYSAGREEILELVGDVDESFIDRIRDTGASIDEIGEAMDDLAGNSADRPHTPSTPCVAEVRRILEELVAGVNQHPDAVSIRGRTITKPII